MAAIMPPIPRFFFTYIEPCLVFFGGFLTPILSPTSIPTLLPPHLSNRTPTPNNYPTPLEHILGLQSAVYMFMIALLTIVITQYSTERKVIRGYVIVSAVTDIPHWGALFWVLGVGGGEAVEDLGCGVVGAVFGAGWDDVF